MRSPAPAAPPDALVEAIPASSLPDAVRSYCRTIAAMAEVEFHRVRREPSVILTRAAQPVLWLLVFGAAVSRVRGLGSRAVPYQAFIVPGVIAQSVLFIAIFSGLAIIWERDLGITQRLLVAPVARSAIIVGKALGAGVRAVAQVCLVLAVVAAARIPLRWSVGGVLGALAAAVGGAMLFSSISMVIASAVRSREQFMGLGQLVTLPLFFASNALYSISLMPAWLQVVARANPLTYEVEVLRRLLLGLGPQRLLLDVAILAGGTVLAVAVASRTYPRRVM
ncbi:MAG: ABC transporter permease [Actinomycetota bacterium]|nr:ABC transporter permease [Actinomycetota bacterium]